MSFLQQPGTQVGKTKHYNLLLSNNHWSLLYSYTADNSVDPKQSYNHAKFETSCFNDAWEKANVNFLFK